MTPRSGSQSGFTLLEVVVAFVVLALITSVVFEVFSTWLARTASLGDQSQALAIAQSKLASVGLGLEETGKEGEARGESPDRRYQWTLKIERYGESADANTPLQSTYSLYRAEARVKWRGAEGREHDLALSNLQLGPRP